MADPSVNDRAAVLLQLGRHAEALETLGEDFDAADSRSWQLRATALIALERYADAETSAEEGLAIEPEDAWLLDTLSAARLGQGDLSGAEEAILAALRIWADDADLLTRYAHVVARDAQMDKAEKLVLRALSVDPENTYALQMHTLLAAASSNPRAMLERSRELLRHTPESPMAHHLLGAAHAEQGRIDDAADHFRRAVSLDPRDNDYAQAAREARAQSHWLMWPLRPIARWGPAVVWIGGVATIFTLRALELHRASTIFAIFWLVYCVYSWVMPSVVKRLVGMLLLVSCAHVPSPVPLQPPEPSPLALVQRAAATLGGTDLSGFRIALQGSALGASGVQARSPRASNNLLTLERTYLVDLAGARGRRDSSQISPGPIRFYTRAIATMNSAQTVDLLQWRSGTDIQSQPAEIGKAALAAWPRMVPHGAIQQALANAATLKYAGEIEMNGRRLDAVTYVDPVGATVTLHLEKESGLPFSATPGEAPNSTYEYGEYRTDNGMRLPQRLSTRSPNFNEESRITTLDLRPVMTAADFELPAGYSDPPPLGEPRAVQIAEGVYRLDGMPQNYHSAFIVDGNDVSVFDAPQNPQWSETALKVIRATAGEQVRIARVLISHHHADHTGGLAPYVAAGATVVCGPAVDEFLRGRYPDARFEVVSASRTFGAGRNRIDAHLVPNEHADGSLAFHLPEQSILLQGDLFYIPERGPVPPAFSVTADLARVIDAKRLDIRTIVGVHGRQGTLAELRESLAKR